jgi:DeoR family transcriptional regulator of aga operon
VKDTRARDEDILAVLRVNGRTAVADIAEALSIGTATVRRDLRRLAGQDRLIRTYGGAAIAPGRLHGPTATAALAEKRAIGKAAADLVHEGETIVLSSGSTTLEFACCLVGRQNLTVITNSLDIVDVLLDRDGIELIVLGGEVRRRMHSLLGHLTDLSAAELRADTFFMGIPAISLEHGLMSDYMPEIDTDRSLSRIAGRIVVLADASKFERFAPAFVFDLDVVSTIVTDSRVRDETLAALEVRAIEVIVADAGGLVRAG